VRDGVAQDGRCGSDRRSYIARQVRGDRTAVRQPDHRNRGTPGGSLPILAEEGYGRSGTDSG